MLRSSYLVAASIVLGGAASAQQVQTNLHQVPSAAKNGGTYHVATGTWTRNVPTGIHLGPDVVYNNTANSNWFGTSGFETEASSFEVVSAGRIPSTSGGAGANRDNYNINGFDLGYCVLDDTLATGPLDVAMTLYSSYTPCADPSTFTVSGAYLVAGIPGSNGINGACWIINVDLTGAETCMLGDGDGIFDSDLDFDSFGMGLEFDPGGAGGYVGAVPVGPLLAGDRNWTAQAAGEILAGTPGGGGGDTYYGPAETCVPSLPAFNSSGYDTQDLWYTGYAAGSANAAGCYWFGGYSNPTGCAANSGTAAPQAAPHYVLYADSTTNCTPGGNPNVGTPFCDPGNNNSTGAPVVMTGTLGSGVGSGLHLEANGGPNTQFGYFLVGTATNTTSPITLSNGLLCLSLVAPNALGRYNVAGGSFNSIGQFDATGVMNNLVGTSTVGTGFDVPTVVPIPGSPSIIAGSTWHFQLWYRDGAAGPGASNLSNGLSVTF